MPNIALTKNRSLLLASLLLVLVVGGALRYILASTYGYDYDVKEYRRFAQKVTIKGPFELYVPDKAPDVDYPPGLPWLTAAVAGMFGGLSYDEKPLFKKVLAGMLAAADIGFCVLLFILALPQGLARACGMSALWALNPQSVFDSGYWAQYNPYLLLALGIAVLMILRKRWFLGGVFYILACLLKPQAWPLAPAIIIWTWREGGFRAIRSLMLGCFIPVLSVWFGFMMAGRAPTLRLMFTGVQVSNDAISYGAHNLWWLFQVAKGARIFSGDPFLLVTYGQAAWLFTGIALMVLGVLWVRVYGKHKGSDGVEMLAIWSALFFSLAPHMHENHAMPVLGLLMIALALGRKVPWQLTFATVLILGNCFLHDHLLLRSLFGMETSDWQSLIVTSGQTTTNTSRLTVFLAVVSLLLAVVWVVRFLQIGHRKTTGGEL